MTIKEFERGQLEDRLQYDLQDPCADCPFLKSTPVEMKGLDADKILLFFDIFAFGANGAHTCHKTDPRSDCPSAQEYKGQLQHCMGFVRMMAKSNVRPGTILRAIAKGKLKPAQLLDPQDKVHTFRGLVKTIEAWAKND